VKEAIGYYQSIESFALVDGPGVRSILFLQGCNMRCLFCHNPDTWNLKNGKPITAREALDLLIRYKPYWADHGGITISGGEPLLQMDFLIEFCRLAKENNITTVIDTAGEPFCLDEPFFGKFKELLKYTNLIMLDIKCFDNDRHIQLTGKTNENIIDMFCYLSSVSFPIWIRQVLLPSYTDDEEILKQTGQFIESLSNVRRVEVLPYHTLGIPKYDRLGIPYRLKGIEPPSKESIEKAETLLKTKNYQDYLSD